MPLAGTIHQVGDVLHMVIAVPCQHIEYHPTKQLHVRASIIHDTARDIKSILVGIKVRIIEIKMGESPKRLCVKLAAIGEIHPDVAEKFDIECRVYVAEIDLDALRPLEPALYGVKQLPKFPAVTRDIALVMDEAVGVGTVLEIIKKSGGKNIESVKLFDIYRGEKLGENKKSVAYALSFRAPDRTLTDEEIAGAMKKILKAVGEEFGAELR